MLEPDKFINIPDTQYHVFQNELLIVQSLLNDDYYSNMTPFKNNDFVRNITYDIAEPLLNKGKKMLQNKIKLKNSNQSNINIVNNDDNDNDDNENDDNENDDNENDDNEDDQDNEDDNNQDDEGKNKNDDHQNETNMFIENHCKISNDKVLGNKKSIWIFKQAKEINFGESSMCSYSALTYILEKELETNDYVQDTSIEYIKKMLCNGYNYYISRNEIHYENIIKILIDQKKGLLNPYDFKNKTLDDIINASNYHLTDLDIWVIADSLNLPIILFSSYNMHMAIDENVRWLYLLAKNKDKYESPMYFLRSKQSKYSLITPNLPYNVIGNSDMKLEMEQRNLKNYMTLEKRLDHAIVVKPK